MKWIVVTGNPREGFEYIGPFDNEDLACEWANKTGQLDEGTNWWTYPILEPRS